MEQLEKTNENLISVIVLVYNGEKYLPECLDSVLNQTYQNLEVIVEMIASNARIKLTDYVGYNYREHQDSVVIKSQRKTTEYYDNMLNMHYCCYVTVKDVSNHVREESALYYKHEILDVSCKLKRWYHDKKAFVQNSRIVRKHLKKVKSVCKLSFKERVFYICIVIALEYYGFLYKVLRQQNFVEMQNTRELLFKVRVENELL